MPRSLMKFAVHPSTPIANPPKTSKLRSYIMVIIGIVVVVLFCDSLFHSNDPHSSNDNIAPILPVGPIQHSLNRNMQIYDDSYSSEDVSNSLEDLLRPKRKSNVFEKNKEETEPSIDSQDIKQIVNELGNKQLLKLMEKNKQNGHDNNDNIDNEELNDNEELTDNEDLIDNKDLINNKDLTYSDYWDFPKSSHIKPDETSSVRHRGEYEMHEMRVDWFKKEYMDKNKAIAPASNLITDFSTRCPVYKTNDKYCKWTPSLNQICNWTNNAIFWHSMHGTKVGGEFRLAQPGSHWIWDFAKELKESGSCSCPQNVAFIFADNQIKEEGTRLVERSYKYCNDNCKFYHVAKDYHPWDWFGKIGPLLELINTQEFKSKFEYVVLTDADDQTLVQSPINIVEQFEFYNASIVIGGEATSFPNWQNQEKGYENAVYPWSRHHQHLNAGGFMGRIVNMIPYLEYMKRDYINFTRDRAEEIKERGRNFWRDQTVWRTMHLKFYPDIKIDSLAKIWTRTDLFMYDL